MPTLTSPISLHTLQQLGQSDVHPGRAALMSPIKRAGGGAPPSSPSTPLLQNLKATDFPSRLTSLTLPAAPAYFIARGCTRPVPAPLVSSILQGCALPLSSEKATCFHPFIRRPASFCLPARLSLVFLTRSWRTTRCPSYKKPPRP